MRAYTGTNWDRKIEHGKVSVRSKVEHPFLIMKRQDKVSKPQEEPAPLLSALCIGESRHVSAGRKAERILLDNRISAHLFPNFSLKREIQEGAIGIALHTLLHCNLCLRTRWL